MSTDGDKPNDPKSPEDNLSSDGAGQHSGATDGNPFSTDNDPFGDALDVGNIFAEEDAPSTSKPIVPPPIPSGDGFSDLNSPDDPFGSSPFSDDASDEPGMDATDDELSGLTEMDLSMIGTYRATKAPETFSSDDVFGGAEPTKNPGNTKTAEKEEIPDDFFSSPPPTQKPTAPSSGGFDDFGSDDSDPFASLGDFGDSESIDPRPSAGSMGDSSSDQNTEFFDFLGDDPAGEQGADPFASVDDASGDNLFSESSDDDTFFVDASGGEEGTADFFGDSFDLEAIDEIATDGQGKEAKRIGTRELQKPTTATVGKSTKRVFAVMGVILLGGVGMGLFTDMGYFGMEILFPPHEKPVWQPVAAQGSGGGTVQDVAPTYIGDIRKLESAVMQAPQDKTAVQTLLSEYLKFHVRFPLHANIFKKGSEQPGSLVPDMAQLMIQVGMDEHPDLEGLNLMRLGKNKEGSVLLAKASQQTAGGETTVLSASDIAFFRALAHYRQNIKLDDVIAEFQKGCETYPDAIEFCYFEAKALLDKANKETVLLKKNTLLRQVKDKLTHVKKETSGLHLPALFTEADMLITARSFGGAAGRPDKTGRGGVLFSCLTMGQQMASQGDVYLAHLKIAKTRGLQAEAETKDPIKKKKHIDEQFEHLEKAFSANPGDANVVMILVNHYEKEGKQLKVIEILNDALNGGCKSPEFYDRIVHSIMPVNLSLAEQYSKQASEDNPGIVDMLLLQAKVFTQKEDWESAQRKYRQAIKANPARADGYIRLAQLLRSRGKTTQAINKLEEGRKRNRKSPALLLALGEFYGETSRFEKAKEAYEQALNLDNKSTVTRTAYALLLNRMGQAKNAVKEFSTLLKGGSSDPALLIHYVRALAADGQSLRAIEQLRKILNMEPQNVGANIEMAILYLDRDNYTGAASHIEQALRTSPDHRPAIYQKGRLAEAQGDRKNAIRFYRRTLSNQDDNVDYRFTLAKALSQSDDTREEAESLLDQILERYQRLDQAEKSKQDPEIYILRGTLWQSAGKLEEALNAYQTALALNKDLLNAKEKEARILFDLSRYNESAQRFQEILSLDKSNVEANFILGQIAHSRGDIANAERLFLTAANTAEGEFAEVNKTLGLLYREKKKPRKSKQYLQRYLSVGSPSAEEKEEVQRIINNLRY